MDKHSGRLELQWTNKDKALLSTGDGKYDYTFVDPSDRRVSEVRLLHEVERVEAPTPADRPDGLPEPTHDNLLITGDAMHVLDSLAKIPEYAEKYLGKVKLVYIDPPFNTGQAFDNYEDNIEHSVWLTMLRDRLRQIMPLLSPDASVWVHLDDEEVHRCRAVMDEELGAENFVAEVVWEKADSPNNSARYLSKDQDYILVYAKSKKSWAPQRLPRNAAADAIYTNPDNDPRGPWYPGDPYANKPYSLGSYEIVGPTGRTFKPPRGRYWRVSEAKFRELEADDRIDWGPDRSARPSIKRFLAEVQGLTPRTLWRHADVGSNRTSKNEMRSLFPQEASFATPKPERLIERVLQIGTVPGDIVLDCFAGSGTTAAVAHKMGRRWITSELLEDTVRRYTLRRLESILTGEDSGGITHAAERVPADGVDLPENVSVADAVTFNRVLNALHRAGQTKVTLEAHTELSRKVRRAREDGDGPLTDDETKTLLRLLRKFGDAGKIDVTKQARSQLAAATKTREEVTQLWHGGGSFVHLEVGPSMFTEVNGRVLLADWATNGELARAMCAQLGVRHDPDGVFAGRRGRSRVAVIDGMVGVQTIEAIVDELLDGEGVEVWATQVSEDAKARLKKLVPVGRVNRIPEAVLDSYRRRAAKRSPFGGAQGEAEK